MNKWIFLLSLGFIFLQSVTAEEEVADEKSAKMVLDFIKQNTKIADPFKLRDPFREPLPYQTKDGLTDDGYRGTSIAPLTVDKVPLNEITISGILIGKERRALATLSNGDSVILKEGMKLGLDKAEIKAILPGGIILVEKMTNVYGQEEYLETVIPITEGKSLVRRKN